MKGKNTTEHKRKSTNKATKRQRQQQKMGDGVEKLLKSSRCPLFLRKTYCMIDSCDSDAIEWSSDGKYFIIKNQDTFVTSMIPRYFKHNNLQSFVRQLNFYGFRKIKTDHIAFGTCATNASRYLCFQHELFVRGRPELLLQIRKPCQKVPSSQKQVEYLKTEVKNLKTTISTMAGEIETLTKLAMELVVRLERDAKRENEMYDDFNKRTKKRKVMEKPAFTSTATLNHVVQTPIHPTLIRTVSDEKRCTNKVCDGSKVDENINNDGKTKAAGMDVLTEDLNEIEELLCNISSDSSETNSDVESGEDDLMDDIFVNIMNENKSSYEPAIDSFNTKIKPIESKRAPKFQSSIETCPRFEGSSLLNECSRKLQIPILT